MREAPGWGLDFLSHDIVCSLGIQRAWASLWLISAVRPSKGQSTLLADQRHSHPLAPGVWGAKRSGESTDAIPPCFEVPVHSGKGLALQWDLWNTNLTKIPAMCYEGSRRDKSQHLWPVLLPLWATASPAGSVGLHTVRARPALPSHDSVNSSSFFLR